MGSLSLLGHSPFYCWTPAKIKGCELDFQEKQGVLYSVLCPDVNLAFVQCLWLDMGFSGLGS